MSYFKIKIRYECAGCGWRWTREFKSKVMHPESLIMVSDSQAPCCKEEAK